jgi:hypothetical protein
MKRIMIIGTLAVISTLALISTSDAANCFKVTEPAMRYGGFMDARCETGVMRNGEYTEIVNHANPLGPTNYRRTNVEGVWCALVVSTEISWFRNRTCSGTPTQEASTFNTVFAEERFTVGVGHHLVPRARTPQRISVNAGTISCSTLEGSGEPKTTKASEITISVKYSGCEGLSAKVTASETEYELNGEGLVGITGKNLVFTDESAGCSIKIIAGGSDKELETVEYGDDTTKGTIEGMVTIKGLHYESSGGRCGTAKKLEENGTYSGEIELAQEGETDEVELLP